MSTAESSVYPRLFAELSPFLDSTADGSHDLSHLHRVWRNALLLSKSEGGQPKLLAAAVILHDCVSVEKNSPLRSQAARLSAEKAEAALREQHWIQEEIEIVTSAIRSHSYSAGEVPTSLEGRILQDADRLDAIGLIGIARCFYTAGRLGSKLYEPTDPAGHNRERNDSRFALDHFPLKLLRLASTFQTTTGKRLANERHHQMQTFYDQFLEELAPQPEVTCQSTS